jgi:FMN phosphatase YigB (HAD superfamily)
VATAITTEPPSADHHPLLAYVQRVIADSSCSVLSLDIFDTVLWRRVPQPTDMFGLLGAKLRADGRCPAWLTDASFRRMRIVAEQTARAGRGSLGTEVSLFDIWQAMPLDLFSGALLEELVEAEVEIERAFTVVDLDVARIIQLARKHDIPVILVSDTYFTEDQLSHLLNRPELGSLQDIRVFRSHQHGMDKASGLWEVVLNEIGMSPGQVVHIGDNKVADDSVPAKLGIRTVFYQRIDDGLRVHLERELEPSDPFGDFSSLIDAEHGDFGITSLRAKTLQAGAPQPTTTATTAWRHGASVLGPVFSGFAEWVAQKAHESGTPVVWCPMREGELLSALINNAARARGWDVEARPIWLSRQVTSVAALDSGDRDAIQEFIRRRHRITVRQLLEMLHLAPGEVPGLSENLETVLDNKTIAAQVSVALTETPHLQNRLAVTTAAARERLLASLRAAGALERPELTLVDVGWHGTIQLQLARVLRLAKTGVTPSGLYLATDDQSTKLHLAGLRAEGFLGQAGHPHEIVGVLTRSPEALEQSVNALCGSLVDFTDDGTPVLSPTSGSPAQDIERQAVQDGVAAFQAQWNRYVTGSGGTWPLLTHTAKARLANIITSSMKLPTAEEASMFGNWEHEDNFGSTVITRVLPEDLVAAIPYLSPPDLRDLQLRDAMWPALIAASDTHLAAAARALAAGAIEPEMFEPAGEQSATCLRFRTADDEWHDGPTRRVRINHNGLSFARMEFEGDDILEVSLAIPGRPALVRIDWIEAKVIAAGQTHVLRWSTAQDFAELNYADCAWLGGTMVEFYSPLAAAWLPLAGRTGAPITSAQLTVAFAMMPRSRSGLGHRMPLADRIERMSAKLREEYRAHGKAGLAAEAARATVRRLKGRS